MKNMRIIDFFNEKKETYIIAEVSQNHDGSLGQAHAFIDAVAQTGADAIKFQTHIAAEESTPYEPFRVNFSYCDKSRYDYWKRMEFTKSQWKGLESHATESGLEFLSSPFSVAALELLDEIGVSAWKFGSGEVFNDLLINKAIETGKPIIISTGLCTLTDIDRIVEKIKRAGNPLLLMECTTAYPSKAKEIPIGMVSVLKNRYGVPIGISDHSATIFPSLAAITLGARAVEVHVTMSREMFGPDVKASVTMDELREIVNGTAFISEMLKAKYDKSELDKERKHLKEIFSKSIYAKRKLAPGDALSVNTISIKKPYNSEGITANKYESVIGLRIAQEIGKDEIIKWEDLER